MSRETDPKKTEAWRKRLGRFDKSDQTAVAFCQSEGVSEASLYYWRKKLHWTAPASGFRAVEISPAAAPPEGDRTSIELGDSVRIRLGNDLPVVETVMRQLLASLGSTGAKTC